MKLSTPVQQLDLFAVFPIERGLPGWELLPYSPAIQICPLDMPELVAIRFADAPVSFLFLHQGKLRCTLWHEPTSREQNDPSQDPINQGFPLESHGYQAH